MKSLAIHLKINIHFLPFMERFRLRYHIDSVEEDLAGKVNHYINVISGKIEKITLTKELDINADNINSAKGRGKQILDDAGKTLGINIGIDDIYNLEFYEVVQDKLKKYWIKNGEYPINHWDFNDKAAALIAKTAGTKTEAEMASILVISMIQKTTQPRDITFGEAFPGKYNLNGFPTVYDIYRTVDEPVFLTDEALNLAKDKTGLKRLLRA
jgi:hypothetical protein